MLLNKPSLKHLEKCPLSVTTVHSTALCTCEGVCLYTFSSQTIVCCNSSKRRPVVIAHSTAWSSPCHQGSPEVSVPTGSRLDKVCNENHGGDKREEEVMTSCLHSLQQPRVSHFGLVGSPKCTRVPYLFCKKNCDFPIWLSPWTN